MGIDGYDGGGRTARVVIGAHFGDEGKGLAVDALAAGSARPVVVRFNGGAQAGHTVVDPDGRRHVFSHVGAGSFLGAPTYLSRFFVSSPDLLGRELAELAAIGVAPRITADPDGLVAIPHDALLNRLAEEARGPGRHGSVGIGFGEAIERSQRGHAVRVRDLSDSGALADRLEQIMRDYLPVRMGELGIAGETAAGWLAKGDELAHGFMVHAENFRAGVTAMGPEMALGRRDVIFEGAQGLLLDQDRGLRFPHVTRSHTGLRNVLALSRDVGIACLDVTYMTRAYLTRHGAGPLPGEEPALAFAAVVDATNVANPWQGALRLAPLDLDLTASAIADDLGDAAGSGVAVRAGIGLTCLDQLAGAARVRSGGAVRSVPADAMVSAVAAAVGLPVVLESRGPTRTTVAGAASARGSALFV